MKLNKYSYRKLLPLLVVYTIDIIFSPVGFFIRKFNLRILNLSRKDRVILINPGGIGDIILMEPLIRQIKDNFPEVKVDVLIRFEIRDVCLLIPSIDKIITFPEKMETSFSSWAKSFLFLLKKISNHYKVGFDIKGDPFSILLMVLGNITYRLGFNSGGLGFLLTNQFSLLDNQPKAQMNVNLASKLLKVKSCNFIPELNSNIFSETRYNYLLSKISTKKKKIITISMSAGEKIKLWPQKLWEDLIKRLLNFYIVVLIGENKIDSLENKNLLNLTGLNLLDSIFIINKSSFFIGLDSGLTHIASAFSIPNVCIFSLAHEPRVWAPSRSYIKTFTPPYSLDLKVEDVYNEVINYLK